MIAPGRIAAERVAELDRANAARRGQSFAEVRQAKTDQATRVDFGLLHQAIFRGGEQSRRERRR